MTAKTEYIVFEKQGRVYLSDILDMTSYDLYQSQLHYSICENLSKIRSTNLEEYKFLTNLYSLKSSLTRSATALTYYIINSESTLQEINVNKKLLLILDPRLLVGVKVNIELSNDPDYVDKSYLLLLLAKSFTHFLFRKFTPKKIPNYLIVRGWVETTSKMYEKEILDGLILLYPFALNFKRQFRFVLWCIKNKVRFHFSGMPYPIWLIIKNLFSGIEFDIIIMHAEMQANSLHSKEVLAYKPKVIFTSDEFETGVFILYEKLIPAGVYIVNTAHGVGQYCPNTAYNEFRVLSKTQSDFYSYRNPETKYVDIKHTGSKIVGIDSYKVSAQKPIAIILIHQPFKEAAYHAEYSVMQFIDRCLLEYSREKKVMYFVKIHPNFKSSIFQRNNNGFKGEIVKNWSDLNLYRLIFITINSTVFFDVKGLAPILVYAGSTFNPSVYFPNPLSKFNETNLVSKLNQLMNTNSWVEAARIHAGHE